MLKFEKKIRRQKVKVINYTTSNASVSSELGTVYQKEAALEQSKILSRILSVRTEKHHENVSQVTRSRGGGFNVRSPKIQRRKCCPLGRHIL